MLNFLRTYSRSTQDGLKPKMKEEFTKGPLNVKNIRVVKDF